MRKNYIFFFLSLVNFQFILAQNVGINATGATPATSAMLDIVSSNSGLLIPRIALNSTTDVTTISSPATSLLVYNTGAGSLTTAGFYYWNGSKWVTFTGNYSNDWSLTGNAGTTTGTNFLGTTDDIDLQFNVNNQRSGLIDHANQQTFLGYQAGLATTTAGNLTTFIGHSSGLSNTSGNANTALGYGSLKNNTTANDNTALGVDAQYYTTGTGNTGIGSHALEGSSTPASNTGIYNTAIGYAAGSGYSGTPNNLPFTTGSYNTFLGFSTDISAGTYTNSTAVGAFAQAGANDVLILGSIAGVNTATNSVKVGIGTTTPASPLHVNGVARFGLASTTTGSLIFNNSSNANTITIQSGVTSSTHALTLPTAQGAANTVLTNDGSGNTSWNTVSSIIGNASYFHNEALASSSTTSTAYTTKVSLTLAAGTYIIFFSGEFESDNYDSGGFMYKFTDGSTTFANGSGAAGLGNYQTLSYIASATYASSTTVYIQFNSTVAAKTARVQNARIIAIKIS